MSDTKVGQLNYNDVCSMFMSGMTLQQIGSKYGVTRERIRQIVSKNGLSKKQGGVYIASKIKAEEKSSLYEKQHFSKYGMSKEDRILLISSGLTRSFSYHKNNARRRGIKFNLTLKQWVTIWEDSGFLSKRGRGHGNYVMSRRGDKGAYEIGNVFIQLADENNREYAIAAHADGRLKPSKK